MGFPLMSGHNGQDNIKRKGTTPKRIRKPAMRQATPSLFVPTRDLPCEPLPQSDEPVIAPENRKGVLELKNNDCRWPIGDPKDAEFHFCAAPRAPGLPYCPTHCARAYQSAHEIEERRKRASKAA
jgi:GcrA cell cycle regulator